MIELVYFDSLHVKVPNCEIIVRKLRLTENRQNTSEMRRRNHRKQFNENQYSTYLHALDSIKLNNLNSWFLVDTTGII